MYGIVLAVFGCTAFSSALTRRFVSLMASSRTMNYVCRLANLKSRSSMPTNTARASLICCPLYVSPATATAPFPPADWAAPVEAGGVVAAARLADIQTSGRTSVFPMGAIHTSLRMCRMRDESVQSALFRNTLLPLM